MKSRLGSPPVLCHILHCSPANFNNMSEVTSVLTKTMVNTRHFNLFWTTNPKILHPGISTWHSENCRHLHVAHWGEEPRLGGFVVLLSLALSSFLLASRCTAFCLNRKVGHKAFQLLPWSQMDHVCISGENTRIENYEVQGFFFKLMSRSSPNLFPDEVRVGYHHTFYSSLLVGLLYSSGGSACGKNLEVSFDSE